MESKIYGVLDSNDCLIDISLNKTAVKRYATLNGYAKIGYRFGYHAFFCSEKINNKWVDYSIHTECNN